MDFTAWAAFVVLILALLALDLGVFHRGEREMSVAAALGWSAFWIALGLAFSGVVYLAYEGRWSGLDSGAPAGRAATFQYLTGYVVEKSLSLDNIFVMALIFSTLGVPAGRQHRVLYLGILGALILRAVMIFAGVALLEAFAWMNYVFGLILFLSAAKLLTVGSEGVDPEKSLLVRLARRLYPVSRHFDGERFFTVEGGRRHMTPLLVALLAIETADVVFAVDSIPAVLAITKDPFLVFTSNAFAILGLRSLYFALAALVHRFRYLRASLVLILAYVGVKMILAHHAPIPASASLAVILGMLALGILASLRVPAARSQL